MEYADGKLLAEIDNGVGIITLNRPNALNALNQATMNELVDALETFDRDDAVSPRGQNDALGRSEAPRGQTN
mgnify:CR=1 FL=1